MAQCEYMNCKRKGKYADFFVVDGLVCDKHYSMTDAFNHSTKHIDKLNKKVDNHKIRALFNRQSLYDYTEYLHKNGYVDSDIYDEPPHAVERWLND